MEGHILWVLENRVVIKAFGPKIEEATWEWKKLRNEELYG